MRRYWDAAAVRPRAWTEAEAAEALRDALRRATVSQMMADVPLGAFLSGGIDSSSIVAFMSEASMQPVNSFSIGFEDGTYNELPYAREVAAMFKTNHREQTVSPNLEELFDQLVVHLDEPFADVSLFPTYLVSVLTRKHVTVALSGDGGDEIIAGHREKGDGAVKGPGVYVYKADDEAGTKWTKHVIDDGGMACEDLLCADLNADGKLDIVAGGRATLNVKLYLNRR